MCVTARTRGERKGHMGIKFFLHGRSDKALVKTKEKKKWHTSEVCDLRAQSDRR